MHMRGNRKRKRDKKEGKGNWSLKKKRTGVRSSSKTADRLSTHDWSVCQLGGALVAFLSLSPFSSSLSSINVLPFVLSREDTLSLCSSFYPMFASRTFPNRTWTDVKKDLSLIRIAEWQSRLPVVRSVHMDCLARPPLKDNRESLSSRYSSLYRGKILSKSLSSSHADLSSSLEAILLPSLTHSFLTSAWRRKKNCWLPVILFP